MKAKALRDYKDKKTGKLVKKDEIVEVNAKRFKEINGTKYGQILQKEEEEKTENKK